MGKNQGREARTGPRRYYLIILKRWPRQRFAARKSQDVLGRAFGCLRGHEIVQEVRVRRKQAMGR
jgi:hypothetical protein